MPSCSVQHCVLFLLTLTFTTDPGSAVCEFPLYAKLHQSVTLPCEHQCSSLTKWTLDSNRDVVFAQCNQTSCRSVKDGYEMSHDQYLKGDRSLIITNPDYSKREKYTCECDYSDYATARLRIDTVFSAAQKSSGEDLKLNVTVPESVEVIYRRSDSADGVQICTVTNGTLQCDTEYTPRTSLSNSELTLGGMKPSDSGTYTIRNLDYKEDIRVYAVSVSAMFSAVQMSPGEYLKLNVTVPEPVEVIYRGSDSADGVQICTVTNRTLQCNTEYTPRTSLSYPELTLRGVTPSNSGTYAIRGKKNKDDIHVYTVSMSAMFSAVQMRSGEDLKLDLSVPESVEVIYRGSDSADDVQICTVTDRTLQCNTEYTPRTSLSYPELTLRDVQRSESGTYTIRGSKNKYDIHVYTVSVSGLIRGETAGIVIAVLFLLVLLIAGVVYCMKKKAEREKEEAERKHREVDHLMKTVDDLINAFENIQQQYEGERFTAGLEEMEMSVSLKEAEEKTRMKKEAVEKAIQEVLNTVNYLERKYGEIDPSGPVNAFCNSKRTELYSKFSSELYTEKESAEQLVKKIKDAMEILTNLKHVASGTILSISDQQLSEMTSQVKSHLNWIDFRCRGQTEELRHVKQKPGDKAGDTIAIRYMEALLSELQQWSKTNESELTKCMKKIKSKVKNEDQSTARNKEGEEETFLTKV